ncbi:MAG: serine/threonine-protein kinase [Chloroflexota bacterium]
MAAAALAAAYLLYAVHDRVHAQNDQPVPELTFVRLGEIQPGQPFDIEFRGVNNGAPATGGSITISFPGNSNVQILASSTLPSGESYAKLFQPGDLMFNFRDSQNRGIQWRTAELYATPWPTNTRHFLRLRVTPSGAGLINARATLRARSGAFTTDPRDGPADQQGMTTYAFDTARLAAGNATATPAPATPTAVPPTVAAKVDPPTVPPKPAPPTSGATAVATVPPTAAPAQAAAPSTPVVRTPTPDPTPTAGELVSMGAVSMLFLIAGISVIGVGVVVGVIGVVFLLRRQSTPAPPSPSGGTPPVPQQFAMPTPAQPRFRPPETDQQTAPRTPRPPIPGTPPPATSRRDASPTLPQSAPSTPHPGGETPVVDRFQNRTLVGRGGMGTVYRAWDSVLPRWVALKVMHPDLAARPDFVERFRREAVTAARLSGHRNIVTIYDVVYTGQELQIVMEWVEGTDLQKLIQRHGVIEPHRAAHILSQVASALDHAHHQSQPVFHRDIKPANIMLTADDEVRLTDFGIAKLIGEADLTGTGQFVGTPEYMAPEQIQGEAADFRADLYALGVVLFQMLTGRLPFRADNQLGVLYAQVHTAPPSPRGITPTITMAAERVVLRALAKDPAQRYASGREMAAAFSEAIGQP